MKPRSALPLAALAVVLGACTVIPTGPSVMALPGSRKSLEEYQADVADCQRYADAVIASAAGGTAANADNRAAASAATGAVLGAATGAIIGSATGQASQGAAIGAGTGLLFGAAAGSPYPAMSSYQLQRGYDQAYLQCMYRRGNQVPVARNTSNARPQAPVYTSPNAAPGGYRPPPPPSTGYPPPANVPPSSYPPPDTPPPANPPPRS
jgi:outer membrane lipoprotein SlyB